MPEEIEAKLRMAAPEEFRRLMARRGFPLEGTVRELNRLFDTPDGHLRAAESALRIREEFDPDTGRPVRSLVTFKGPRAPGPLKRRPEHETVIASAAALAAVFEGLGLAECFRYEKRRTAWRAGACEVALDEVPHLGWFVEVEGPSEEAIRAALADLGLAAEPLVPQSYVALLWEHLESKGLDPRRAVFE
jgi:adenylate cyclase class 2